MAIPSTARVMVQGLSGAEGALIDPVTGDFLFSTFGGNNTVVRISGFAEPNTGMAGANMTSTALTPLPNPTTGRFQLDLTGERGTLTMDVVSISGASVLHRTLAGGGIIWFDLSDADAGLYHVRVQNGAMLRTGRIVVE
jgi:hypothetical protein